VYNV